jgi:hypothetical protein
MMGLVLGCQRQSTPRIVPFDEVPPDLLQKAKEALPEVRFDNAVRRSDGGFGSTFNLGSRMPNEGVTGYTNRAYYLNSNLPTQTID